MSSSFSPRSSFLIAAIIILTVGLVVCCDSNGQVLNQDQEIHVHNLPSVTAHSQDPSDILLAALETIFGDKEVCCSKNSALGDKAAAADPRSLKDIVAKLDGRHLLSDGRPIHVTADYVVADAINGGTLISMVLNGRPALMQWNSHLYVLHGVIYRWIESGDPATRSMGRMTVVYKLLLWDMRFSDSRREVVFDRTTDDLSKVQGMLFLQAAPQ